MDIKTAIVLAIAVLVVATMLPIAISSISTTDSTPYSTSGAAVDITSTQVTLLDDFRLPDGDEVEEGIYKANIDVTAIDIDPISYDLVVNLTESDGTFIATINSTTAAVDIVVTEDIKANLEPYGLYDITAATSGVLNCTVTSDYSLEGEVFWGSAVRSMWILVPLFAILAIVVVFLSRAMKEL